MRFGWGVILFATAHPQTEMIPVKFYGFFGRKWLFGFHRQIEPNDIVDQRREALKYELRQIEKRQREFV